MSLEVLDLSVLCQCGAKISATCDTSQENSRNMDQLPKDFSVNVSESLDRLAVMLGIEPGKYGSETALGKELGGTTSSTVASWRSRNSLPIERIALVCREKDISLNYVVFGIGPQRLSDPAAENQRRLRLDTHTEAKAALIQAARLLDELGQLL